MTTHQSSRPANINKPIKVVDLLRKLQNLDICREHVDNRISNLNVTADVMGLGPLIQLFPRQNEEGHGGQGSHNRLRQAIDLLAEEAILTRLDRYRWHNFRMTSDWAPGKLALGPVGRGIPDISFGGQDDVE